MDIPLHDGRKPEQQASSPIPSKVGGILGAEYPSPKKVNLLNYYRFIYAQKVKGYLLSP